MCIHVGIHGSISLLLCKDEVLKPSETDGLVDWSCGNFIRCWVRSIWGFDKLSPVRGPPNVWPQLTDFSVNMFMRKSSNRPWYKHWSIYRTGSIHFMHWFYSAISMLKMLFLLSPNLPRTSEKHCYSFILFCLLLFFCPH